MTAPVPFLSARLSAREREVLALLSQGLSNTAIGRELGIAEATVKTHVHAMFRKLAVHNRTALAHRANGHGGGES